MHFGANFLQNPTIISRIKISPSKIQNKMQNIIFGMKNQKNGGEFILYKSKIKI